MWCSVCAEGCIIALGKAESRGLAPSLVAEDPVPIGGRVCGDAQMTLSPQVAFPAAFRLDAQGVRW